jgi:hypothetical protein
MLRKQRWRKSFPDQEKIDRVEKDHELRLERHQLDVIFEQFMLLTQSQIVFL